MSIGRRALGALGAFGAFACALAFAAACAGAAHHRERPPSASPPSSASDPGQLPAAPRAEIDELSRKIDQELAAMGLPPAATSLGCAEPSCAARPMTAGVSHAEDPECRPAGNDRCKAACTFSDSICSASARICKLADDLPGDAYARDKCESGARSCHTSRASCCGCQP